MHGAYPSLSEGQHGERAGQDMEPADAWAGPGNDPCGEPIGRGKAGTGRTTIIWRSVMPGSSKGKQTRPYSFGVLTGAHGYHTTYYVTFQVDSGDRMELSVSGSEYGMLVDGDRGKLSFQGTRYLSFERC